MTLSDIRPPMTLPTRHPTDEWTPATWEEFLHMSDDPAQAKATCYYYNHHMRIETMGVGPNHAIDNGLIYATLVLYCTLTAIACRGLVNASYRKPGFQEAQPDASFYLRDRAHSVPQGNTIIDLSVYPAPDLAIEVAATTLNDDLGTKRLLYEELGIQEYWVVDVARSRVFAFAIHTEDQGSHRITTSQVLPGLEIAILETALRDRATQDDSQIMATLMQQFQTRTDG